jgi:hypothetical protein
MGQYLYYIPTGILEWDSIYTIYPLGMGQYLYHIPTGALEWDSIYTHRSLGIDTHRSLGMGQYLSHIVYIILLYQMKYHRRGVFEVLPALELSPQGYKC